MAEQDSSARIFPFMNALADLNTFHGLDMSDDDFLEIGMRAWRRIGNKESEVVLLFGAETDDDGYLELPCTTYRVDAVTIDYPDGNILDDYPGGLSIGRFYGLYNDVGDDNFFRYLSARATFRPQKEIRGTYVPYVVDRGEFNSFRIKVDERITSINVLYTRLKVDDEDLPYISEKESQAIATFCAMTLMHKSYIRSRRQDDRQVYFDLKQEYNLQARNARVQEKLTQNHIDDLLNVKTSLDRKWYNRSFKLYRDA